LASLLAGRAGLYCSYRNGFKRNQEKSYCQYHQQFLSHILIMLLSEGNNH
jgi:hypothetical protein